MDWALINKRMFEVFGETVSLPIQYRKLSFEERRELYEGAMVAANKYLNNKTYTI